MTSWIQILQALLTPTIGLIAAYVAWQQYRLAKQKHDIDIFNRRMQVYKTTVAFLVKCEKDVAITEDDFYEWIRDVSDAEFLFGQEILDLLEDIDRTAAAIIFADKTSQPPVPIDDEYEMVTIDPKNVDRFNDFLTFRGKATELFAPYFQTFLKFKAVQRRSRYKELIKERQEAIDKFHRKSAAPGPPDENDIPF